MRQINNANSEEPAGNGGFPYFVVGKGFLLAYNGDKRRVIHNG